jgi:ribonuclease HI
MVVKTWHRIKHIRKEIWDGCGSGALGHRRALQKLSEQYGSKEYVWDEIPETRKFDRLYKVDVESFKTGTKVRGAIKCFTDGSRINGKAGAGYCIMVNSTIVAECAIPLGKYPTVFQAEVMAVHHAAEKLLEYVAFGNIVIHSDSQAALLALDNPVITAKTVLATVLNLDKLAERQKVELTWVRAHIGTMGNERADMLAKTGSNTTTMDPEPIIPVPKVQFDRDIDAAINEKWRLRWLNLLTARQSKLFWPQPNKIRSRALLEMSRKDFGLMIQLFSGHNYFNRHKNLLHETESAICRLCLEEEESSEHLLCDCPALNELRFEVLGHHQTDTKTCSLMTIQSIRHFTLLICQRLNGLE